MPILAKDARAIISVHYPRGIPCTQTKKRTGRTASKLRRGANQCTMDSYNGAISTKKTNKNSQALAIFSLDKTPPVAATNASSIFPLDEKASGPIRNAALSCETPDNRGRTDKWYRFGCYGRQCSAWSRAHDRDESRVCVCVWMRVRAFACIFLFARF